MKTLYKTLTLLFLLLVGLLLSGCTGGAGVANSWPGVTVAGETAYLAYNTHVYAVNLADGTLAWRFPEKAANQTTFFAPPTLTDDGQLLVGSFDKSLYSLDVQTGAEIAGKQWPFTGAKNHYVAQPLVLDDMVFAPDADGTLYALGVDGAPRWTWVSTHGLWATPVANGDVIYVAGMDHRVTALETASGSVRWQSDDLGGALVSAPTLVDGTLYLGTLGSEVLALDAANGQVRWRAKTTGWVWAAPTVDGDTLYVGDLDGQMYALDAANGNVRWQVQPDVEAVRSLTDRPLLLDGVLYYASESGKLWALNAENGTVRWSKDIGGKLHTTPLAFGENHLLLAPMGADALLVAVDANGNPKWEFIPPK
jgi:outer membrane protein assembly factor BamB